MAAAIATVATNSEQQLLEVAGSVYAQETAELAKDTPAITARRISIVPNFANNTVQIIATLPITSTVDADGGMSFDVDEQLPAA